MEIWMRFILQSLNEIWIRVILQSLNGRVPELDLQLRMRHLKHLCRVWGLESGVWGLEIWIRF